MRKSAYFFILCLVFVSFSAWANLGTIIIGDPSTWKEGDFTKYSYTVEIGMFFPLIKKGTVSVLAKKIHADTNRAEILANKTEDNKTSVYEILYDTKTGDVISVTVDGEPMNESFEAEIKVTDEYRGSCGRGLFEGKTCDFQKQKITASAEYGKFTANATVPTYPVVPFMRAVRIKFKGHVQSSFLNAPVKGTILLESFDKFFE